MCGIVGLMAGTTLSDKQLALFSGLLYLDQSRGMHATGIIKVNPWQKKVSVHKAAQSAQVFLGREDTHEFLEKERGRIYIGHNRYATLGDKTKDDNAHPFNEGHITMVHNGGVDRWTLDKLEGHDDDAVEVDSHMVCKTIAKDGIAEAIKKFSGAFTLVWWDSNERSLNFLRNKERPLWLCSLNEGSLVWASEREFIDAFVNRKANRLTYKEEPRELPPNLLVSYKFNEHGVILNGGSCYSTPMEFESVPDPKPPARVYTSGYSTYGYASGAAHYDQKANALMAFNNLDCRIGDTITCKVLEMEETVNNPSHVNIHMDYEGMEVICYYVNKKLVDGAKWLSGKITNCYERDVFHKESNSKWSEARISIASATLTRVVNKPTTAPKSERRLTVVGNVFPLKTQGHTFRDQYEWTDFVCNGCTMCGKVPTSYDVRNKSLTVYSVKGFQGLLKDCEFICGQCTQETEPDDKGNKA